MTMRSRWRPAIEKASSLTDSLCCAAAFYQLRQSYAFTNASECLHRALPHYPVVVLSESFRIAFVCVELEHIDNLYILIFKLRHALNRLGRCHSSSHVHQEAYAFAV